MHCRKQKDSSPGLSAASDLAQAAISCLSQEFWVWDQELLLSSLKSLCDRNLGLSELGKSSSCLDDLERKLDQGLGQVPEVRTKTHASRV